MPAATQRGAGICERFAVSVPTLVHFGARVISWPSVLWGGTSHTVLFCGGVGTGLGEILVLVACVAQGHYDDCSWTASDAGCTCYTLLARSWVVPPGVAVPQGGESVV
eukprot:CAMPEP_0174364272 /NCGR_PEP_ID=MMETSP0811_2-20130205/72168_1 /TAXON_ID=73025 ORGANISM="Eutreptiella gymnastica-like, Strain CCMP1594" /NCGR_SAMPLE_ID=MMETSP0811_2 /ASSEMBLY_ACC=CAM_ASM_000667 /LENGTH=107 /DNA_ID=CAMNT_0015503745 /DNA_START=205 /DNA_END=528 /DNA_ORIENTATION=-